MKHTLTLILIILIFSLTACVHSDADPAGTNTSVPPTETLAPTATITPEPTISPSPTNIPSLTPTPTQIPFNEFELLTILDQGISDGTTLLVFSQNNYNLAIGNFYEHFTNIWDIESGDVPNQLGNETRLNVALAFSPNGRYAVSAFHGWDQLQVWDIYDDVLIGYIPLRTQPIQDTYLEFINDDTLGIIFWNTIELIAFPDGRLIDSLVIADGTQFVDGDFSNEGNLVAGVSWEYNDITVWDLISGEIVMNVDQEDANRSQRYKNYYSRTQIQFSPDGSKLAASFGSQVNIWDISTGEILTTYEGTEMGVEYFTELLFSPDGKFLIGNSFVQGYPGSGRTYIWNILDGDLVEMFPHNTNGMRAAGSMALSWDGKFLALGTWRGRVYVFGKNETGLSPQIISAEPNIPKPTSTPVALPYEEDFEDGVAANWEIFAGSWTIAGGEANHYWVGTGSSDYPQAWLFSVQNWTDYAFETRIRIIAGGVFICTRAADRNFYNVFVNSNDSSLVFAQFLDGNYETFGEGTISLQRNIWYTMRFEVRGNDLRFYIDDELVLESTRTALSEGGIGFYIGGGDEVHFDDIKVWSLE